MLTIGLIGGMSWESTQSYYQLINRQIKHTLGGLHSAKLVLVSVDFAEIEACQRLGDWHAAGEILSQAARRLEAAGADFFMICTNTMHKVADQVCAAVNIPLLHIADTTALQLQKKQITKVALLGTRFTMQEDFYKGRLQQQFNIDVIVPSDQQQQQIHDIIYQELCLGKIEAASRQVFISIMQEMAMQGAAGIILGCTEIGLLVSQEDCTVELFDTVAIHATSAVQLALT